MSTEEILTKLTLVLSFIVSGTGLYFSRRKDNREDDTAQVSFATLYGAKTVEWEAAFRKLEAEFRACQDALYDARASAKREAKTRASAIRAFKELCNDLLRPIFIDGADGGCEFVNKAWYDMTGLPVGKALGNGWFAVIGGDDAYKQAKGEEWMRRCLSDEADDGEFELQYKHYRSGALIDTTVKYRTIHDGEKAVQIIGMVIVKPDSS